MLKKYFFKYLLILSCIINIQSALLAQKNDYSNTKKSLIVKSILPASLIVVGSSLNHSILEKNWKLFLRNRVGNQFEFKIDDYIQYAPIVQLYLADVCNVKAENHWFDQTKYLLISNLITSGITESIKHLTLKTRPNGGQFSFPSGHTTFAFTNAAVLYHEFSNTAPVLAYSGYLFSTATGAFRMINNKHWLSDVLVGAGIGMIVTHLVYYLKPFKNFNPFKNTQNLSFIPTISNNQYGFKLNYLF